MKKIIKLESTTERAFVNFVQLLGYSAIKIQKRGWPDRLVTLENGYAFYIEFKRAGKKAESLQEYTHNKIRNKGFHVYVCDNITHAKRVLAHEEIVCIKFVKKSWEYNN